MFLNVRKITYATASQVCCALGPMPRPRTSGRCKYPWAPQTCPAVAYIKILRNLCLNIIWIKAFNFRVCNWIIYQENLWRRKRKSRDWGRNSCVGKANNCMNNNYNLHNSLCWNTFVHRPLKHLFSKALNLYDIQYFIHFAKNIEISGFSCFKVIVTYLRSSPVNKSCVSHCSIIYSLLKIIQAWHICLEKNKEIAGTTSFVKRKRFRYQLGLAWICKNVIRLLKIEISSFWTAPRQHIQMNFWRHFVQFFRECRVSSDDFELMLSYVIFS